MIQEDLFKPESHWRAQTFRSLEGADVIAIDLETHDRGIANKAGAGWATKS